MLLGLKTIIMASFICFFGHKYSEYLTKIPTRLKTIFNSMQNYNQRNGGQHIGNINTGGTVTITLNDFRIEGLSRVGNISQDNGILNISFAEQEKNTPFTINDCKFIFSEKVTIKVVNNEMHVDNKFYKDLSPKKS